MYYIILYYSSAQHDTTSTCPFAITGDFEEHTPYSYNQYLHQWIDTHRLRSAAHATYDTLSPPPLLYDIDHLQSTVVRATLIYQQDLLLFLSFTE